VIQKPKVPCKSICKSLGQPLCLETSVGIINQTTCCKGGKENTEAREALK